MKYFAFSALLIVSIVFSANAQDCPKGTLDENACNQVFLLRVDTNRESASTRSVLTETNKKLDTVNGNLATLIELLKTSNSNTSSTANSASTTNTRLNDTMTQIRQQNEQANEILHNLIIERFKSLPADLLTNPLFKAEIDKLRDDILKEVGKRKP